MKVLDPKHLNYCLIKKVCLRKVGDFKLVDLNFIVHTIKNQVVHNLLIVYQQSGGAKMVGSATNRANTFFMYYIMKKGWTQTRNLAQTLHGHMFLEKVLLQNKA